MLIWCWARVVVGLCCARRSTAETLGRSGALDVGYSQRSAACVAIGPSGARMSIAPVALPLETLAAVALHRFGT